MSTAAPELTLRHTLQPVGEELWIVEQPLSALGGRIEVGRRMTVCRLTSGELWLHSVGRLTEPLRAGLDELGPVRFVVSPNAYHHRYMEQYAEAYPGVQLFASPGLRRKRPDLEFAGCVEGTPDPRWAEDLDQLVFEGLRMIREVIFLHRRSKTLILTDLCAQYAEPAQAGARRWAKLQGTWQRFAMARALRIWPRDKAAARASAERLMSWDFERVIVAHGQGLESGGKQGLRAALAWAL